MYTALLPPGVNQMYTKLLPPGVNQMYTVLLPPGVNQMYTVLLPPGVNPIEVNNNINDNGDKCRNPKRKQRVSKRSWQISKYK
jgi:hypothetical protein